MTLSKNIYCANDQKVTAHTCSVDANKEILCACEVCGHVVKFALMARADFDNLVARHQTSSAGQVTEAQKAAVDADIENAFKAMFGIGGII